MTIFLVGLQVVLLVVLIKLMRRPAVSPILLTSLFIFGVLWYIAPVFIRVLWGSEISTVNFLGDDTYAFYGIVETMSLLVTLLCLFYSKPYFRAIRNNHLVSMNISPALALLIILLGIWVISVFNAQRAALGVNYLERNAFAITGEGTAQYDSIGSFSLLQTLFVSFGYASLLVKWPRRIRSCLSTW